MTEKEIILEGQLRECFGRVVYSHKTQEICADILLKWNHRLKLAQIILSALSTGGFIITIFGEGQWGAVLGVIISIGLLVLNAYTKNYDLGELAQKHRQTASELWLIRESYLSLLTDLRLTNTPIESLVERRDELLDKLHSIYASAPSTNSNAYGKAQTALKKNEDLTFSETEIDAFLPKELKRTHPGDDSKAS